MKQKDQGGALDCEQTTAEPGGKLLQNTREES